ncbi:MAG: arylsulfatase A-like enzyme [Planctomycetota bacterium]|jgi:arylsulfatase A-like enzyme
MQLELSTSVLNLPVAGLLQSPDPQTLVVRDSNSVELKRGDLAQFATGEAEFTFIPAKQRIQAGNTARQGGRFQIAKTHAHDHDEAPDLDHFVLTDSAASLRCILPILVPDQVFEVYGRWRPNKSEANNPPANRAGQLKLETGSSTIAIEFDEPNQWQRYSARLGLTPGLGSLVLSTGDEQSPAEFDIAWVALSHDHGDKVVLSRATEADLFASFVPAIDPDAIEEAWKTHDVFQLPLWKESGSLAPENETFENVLVCSQINGDRRPGFLLAGGSELELEFALKPGDQLRFAVGLPDLDSDGTPIANVTETEVRFQVSWLPEKGAAQELDNITVIRIPDVPRGWQTREVKFDAAQRGPGKLLFRTTGDEPVPAVFADPRIVHAEAPIDARFNLVVYVIDTLRADHLSTYGSRNPTSPRIDKLAEEGFRFDQFYAIAPWTRPTTASILTGYYPDWHGMGWELPLPFSLETMAESLAKSGYSTWAAVANPQVGGPTLQFSQGFHRFVDHTGIGVPSDGKRAATSRQLNSTVLPWLAANGDEPFFLYLHSLDPHTPYAPPPDAEAPFGRGYRGPMFEQSLRRKQLLASADEIGEADVAYIEDVYDNEILYQDRQIGVLLDALEQHGLMEETIFLVLSDHGEEFRDHDDWNHGYRMWEELLRVPLIVWLPERERTRLNATARVIPEVVSQVDLLPGLMELLQIKDDFPRQGRSWLPLLNGEPADLLPFLAQDFQTWEGVEIGSFRLGDYKLTWTRFEDPDREVYELYDLERDPGEQTNLFEQEPERVQELLSSRDAMLQFNTRIRGRLSAKGLDHVLPASGAEEPAALTEEEILNLEALGYTQGRE